MTAESCVVDAKVLVLRARVDDGIAMSFAPLHYRSMVLVELRTDDGCVGYGESWVNFPSWAPIERVATLREGVFPLIMGKDIRDIAQIHHDLKAGLEPIGRQWGAIGPIMQAISAVDMALWDLRGKATGMAASRLLGTRVRDSVAIYASSLGPEKVAKQGIRCKSAGHRAVKVKLGFGAEVDEMILAEARDSIGGDTILYADANQAWTVPEAAAMAPMLNAFKVEWIEEPVRGNHLSDLEELHRLTGLAIATGENIYGLEGFRRYAESPAISVLQPDVAKTGGLTEALAICEYAKSCGKPVMPHLYGGSLAYAATLQLAACAPAVVSVEYDIRSNPLRDDLLINSPRPEQGSVNLPDRPGLGIELDLEAVRAFIFNDIKD